VDDVTYYTDAEGKTRCCCCAGNEAGHEAVCPHFKGATPEPRDEAPRWRLYVELRETWLVRPDGLTVARLNSSLSDEEADALVDTLNAGEAVREVFLGTCDWGDCDRLAVTTRSENEDAPHALPVCIQHSEEYVLVEREHAALVSMVEKAASTLRQFAEAGDEDDPVDAGIRQDAKRTLKAMREIGGFDV